jgi:hypothetical protein
VQILDIDQNIVKQNATPEKRPPILSEGCVIPTE